MVIADVGVVPLSLLPKRTLSNMVIANIGVVPLAVLPLPVLLDMVIGVGAALRVGVGVVPSAMLTAHVCIAY